MIGLSRLLNFFELLYGELGWLVMDRPKNDCIKSFQN